MTTPDSRRFARLRVARDRAADAGDLPGALELDNELEDHARLGGWPRRTCWQCHSWADHIHEPLTGARMHVESGHPVNDRDAAVAVQVFAVAAALPHRRTETHCGAQIAIDLGPYRYLVAVHIGPAGDQRRRAVFISGCVHRGTGHARAFPVIHASERGAAAIIEAYLCRDHRGIPLHAPLHRLRSHPDPARRAGPH